MLRGIDHLLADKPSAALAAQSAALVQWSLANEGIGAVGSDPVNEMGGQGTGGPWWIWVIVGVLVALLAACVIYACVRKRKREREEQTSEGLNQIIFEDAHDGLDAPLIT